MGRIGFHQVSVLIHLMPAARSRKAREQCENEEKTAHAASETRDITTANLLREGLLDDDDIQGPAATLSQTSTSS